MDEKIKGAPDLVKDGVLRPWWDDSRIKEYDELKRDVYRFYGSASAASGLASLLERVLDSIDHTKELLGQARNDCQQLTTDFSDAKRKASQLSAEEDSLDKENRNLKAEVEKLKSELAVANNATVDRDATIRQLREDVRRISVESDDSRSLLFQSRETVGRQLDIIENLAQVLDKVSAY